MVFKDHCFSLRFKPQDDGVLEVFERESFSAWIWCPELPLVRFRNIYCHLGGPGLCQRWSPGVNSLGSGLCEL